MKLGPIGGRQKYLNADIIHADDSLMIVYSCAQMTPGGNHKKEILAILSRDQALNELNQVKI